MSSGFPLGADTVSLQSVGAGPRGRAFLAVGRPGQLTAARPAPGERRRHAADDQAGAVVGHRRRARAAAVRRAAAGAVRPERAGPADRRATVGAAADGTGDGAGGDRGSPTSDAAELDDRTLPSAGRVLVAELDGELVVLVGGGRTRRPTSRRGSSWPVSICRRRRRGRDVRRRPTYADIAAAYRQALQADDFGRRHGRAVTRFDEISMPGITGMLGRGPGARLRRIAAAPRWLTTTWPVAAIW